MSRRSLVIGLTGNIATGKSTILNYLMEKCAFIIDADKLGHRVIEPGGQAFDAVVRTFGREILGVDGSIDLKPLGKIVFSNSIDLGSLEKIVHPKIVDLGKQEIYENDSPVIVLEAIPLLEARLLSTLCDEIWMVTPSLATQLLRLLETRRTEDTEATRMTDLQPTQAHK